MPHLNKGKPKSEEHKKKLSEANKGKVSSWKGKKHTEESRVKISANLFLNEIDILVALVVIVRVVIWKPTI